MYNYYNKTKYEPSLSYHRKLETIKGENTFIEICEYANTLNTKITRKDSARNDTLFRYYRMCDEIWNKEKRYYTVTAY